MPLFGRTNNKRHTTVVPTIPDPSRVFTMPPEEAKHEGTWLQWPHNCTTSRGRGHDKNLIRRYEPSWVEMTKALHTGEKVHIIVYDDVYLERVQQLLRDDHQCDMSQINFFVYKTDDVWIRDNGPVFVRDEDTGRIHITDWGFNGWGEKCDYELSNRIPSLLAKELNIPITTIPMINEGGSVEIDGRGTLMAKKSSILNRNRNPGWTQADAERYFTRYLGVRNFIWLNGQDGGYKEITDDHIDGTCRFANGDTIVTFYREDFVDPREYDLLKSAKDINGNQYHIVHLPVTTRKVVNRDYGFYINFYVGNEVVLIPSFGKFESQTILTMTIVESRFSWKPTTHAHIVFKCFFSDDPNDDVACATLQRVYPDRRMVKIPMKEVLKDGGMVHCVTQQQPII
jgi:agmatine deiminase